MKIFGNFFCAIFWYKNSLCVQISWSWVLKWMRFLEKREKKQLINSLKKHEFHEATTFGGFRKRGQTDTQDSCFISIDEQIFMNPDENERQFKNIFRKTKYTNLKNVKLSQKTSY